jgi:hypothetical protein
MRNNISSRDLAFSGLFGAAGLLLPILFHMVQLGPLFMPMYLPLVTLAFFVRPLPAALTAFITPLLSGAVTGMPPFFPPIALFMAVELSVMGALIAVVHRRWPGLNEWLVLVPTLFLGRVLNVGLVYLFSYFIQLPAGFMAGFSFVSGWPGIVLMIAVVPVIARNSRSMQPTPARFQKGNGDESNS